MHCGPQRTRTETTRLGRARLSSLYFTENPTEGDLRASPQQPCRPRPRNTKISWPSPWVRNPSWRLLALEKFSGKGWRRRVLTRPTWCSGSF